MKKIFFQIKDILKNLILTNHFKRSFSLQEAVITLTIMSMVSAVQFNIIRENSLNTKLNIDDRKLDKIEKAITTYFLINKRLPCPADPTLGIDHEDFGKEYLDSTGTGCAGDFIGNSDITKPIPIMNQTFDGTLTNSNLTSTFDKIKHHYILFGSIPFRTLAISAENAIDEHGNLFTYSIPESLANYNRHINPVYQNTKIGKLNVFDQDNFDSSTKDIRNQNSTCTENNFIGVFYNDEGSDIYENFQRVFNTCKYTIKGSQQNLAYVIIKHNKRGDCSWNKYGDPKETTCSENSYFYYKNNYNFDNQNSSNQISFNDSQSVFNFDTKEKLRYKSLGELINDASSNEIIHCHPTTFINYFQNYSCDNESCNNSSFPYGLKDTTATVNNITALCDVSGNWIVNNDVAKNTDYNRIINGGMSVDQRNAGSSGNHSGYTVDRFLFHSSQINKILWQKNLNNVNPPDGFINYLGLKSIYDYTPSYNDYSSILQRIEGNNLYDFNYGKSNAITANLSFFVQSNLTGTFSGSIINPQANKSFVFEYTIQNANVWEKKMITIPGDINNTIHTDNQTGLEVTLNISSGSNFLTNNKNSWISGNYYGTINSKSLTQASNNVLYVTGFQFKKDLSEKSFDFRDIQAELQLCQRYYEKSYNQSDKPSSVTTDGKYYWLSAGANGRTDFKVSKRAVPTVTVYSILGNPHYGTNSNDIQTPATIEDSSENGFNINFTNESSTNAAVYGHWTADAEL